MIFLGVDIGSCAVKAVALQKSGKALSVLQTHFFSIKPTISEDQKKLLILSHLKTLSDLYSKSETRYIFAFTQSEISTEKISFPFKEKRKILKSLPFELEEKLSLFDYQTLISDIRILPSTKNKTDILVFSAFRNQLTKWLKELKSLNIDPFMVTCSADALSRLFVSPIKKNKRRLQKQQTSSMKKNEAQTTQVEQKDLSKECDIYLQIGHSHTLAMVFSNQHLQNVYSFEWGVAVCIRRLAVKYEISFEKAMKQFTEEAFILTQTKGYTGSQIEFSKVIKESFDRIIDKLRLFILQIEGEDFYKCKKIFIFGGGAQIRNLQTVLSSELGLPVARVDKVPAFSEWNLRNNDQKQNNLITALATALIGARKTKTPVINFLKEEFALDFNPFKMLNKKWRSSFAFVLCLLVLLCIYAGVKLHQSETLLGKINKVFTKQAVDILKVSSDKVHVDRVRNFIESKNKLKRQALLTNELSKIPSALNQIIQLSVGINKNLDWGLDIQELEIKDRTIKLKGYIVADYLPVFKNNLKSLVQGSSLETLLEKDIKSKEDEVPAPLKRKNKMVFQYLISRQQG